MQKTGSNRDDFSSTVKMDLAKRVNFRCSICDVQTTGPQKGTKKAFNIGKAAHIKAAAPNGPRYDPAQSSEERASFDNGLWACANCADIIDRNEAAYSVEQLLQHKEDAERRAETRVGTVPAAHAALVPTRTSINRAIQMYCLSEAARYEQMDPRFNVAVSWANGNPLYEFRANEPVTGHLIFGGEALSTADALRDVLDYGGSFTVRHDDIRLEGSPVFAEDDGRLKELHIASHAQDVSLAVGLGPDDALAMFVDFQGKATVGQKGFRFQGEALNGLASVTQTFDFATRRRNFQLSFDVSQWCGKPLSPLPHYGRLQQFARRLTPGTPVFLRISLNGVESDAGRGHIDSNEFFRWLRAFMLRLEVLRSLDEFFQLGLTMPADVDDVLRDHLDIVGLLSMLEVAKAEKQEIGGTIIAPESVAKLIQLIEDQEVGLLELREPVAFRAFGRDFGPFKVNVSCPKAFIVLAGPARIEPGMPVPLLFKATEGHHWTPRYEPTV